MLSLNHKVIFFLLCNLISCIGLSNGVDVSGQVFVFLSNDMSSFKTLLKETTIVFHNGSSVPIFLPSERWKSAFVDAIQFEMHTSTTVDSVFISPKEEEVRFAPTYYKLEPGCSISRTFFWHSDLSDPFYSTLSRAEQIRVRWSFFYYDSNNEIKQDYAFSKWLSKDKFKDGVSIVEEDMRGLLTIQKPSLDNQNTSFESTVEIILDSEL